MKRLFDIVIALAAAVVLLVPALLVAIAVKLSSRGTVLYWSDRIGRDNHVFHMPKFRSMRTDAPVVATHLLDDADRWVTPLGRLLRVTSIDELPQLWSVLKGDMSLVGPRPALFNQHDLIALREQHGVHVLRPGLTGWAQINGRDEIPIAQKVALDAWYLQHRSLALDLRILVRTAFKVIRREDVAH